MIAVRGRADLVETLARRRDVARIEANAPIRSRLPLPETVSPGFGLGLESVARRRRGPGPEPREDRRAGRLGGRLHGTGRRRRRRGHRLRLDASGAQGQVPRLERHDGGSQLQLARRRSTSAPAETPAGPNATAPCDDDTHGTHTMGTMVGDDGAGNQIGVAPGAKWIGCRNMDRRHRDPGALHGVLPVLPRADDSGRHEPRSVESARHHQQLLGLPAERRLHESPTR